MNKEKEKLFSDFSPVSTEDWKNKIVEDLKGADYDKKMIWRTNEGFNVKPTAQVKNNMLNHKVPGIRKYFPRWTGNAQSRPWQLPPCHGNRWDGTSFIAYYILYYNRLFLNVNTYF